MGGRGNRVVHLLHWPTEQTKRDWCREHHVPRVLLVAPGAEPPQVQDVFEDWVRPPLSQLDLHARVRMLEERRQRFDRPELTGAQELSFRGSRVSVSKTQACLAQVFVEHYRDLVPRSVLADELLRVTTPTTGHRNVLDLHITRLRRKVADIGLVISTVWGSGYQLEPSLEAGVDGTLHRVG